MKAKQYRDLLIGKYNFGRHSTNLISQRDIRKLVYRFLCEKGLWWQFVTEVRHHLYLRGDSLEPMKINGQNVLSRIVENADRTSDTLIRVVSTFDWTKALFGEKGEFGHSLLWQDLYNEWLTFLTPYLTDTQLQKDLEF